MNETDLLKYYQEIVSHLPSIKLSELNLETELLIQYHTVKGLQTDVLEEESVPPNQKAQVANTVAATLNKIVDMQQEVYTSERFKAIENLLIRTLNKLPEEVAKVFIDQYEQILRGEKG